MVGIINGRKDELEAMDRKSRKMMTYTTAYIQELMCIAYTSPESTVEED